MSASESVSRGGQPSTTTPTAPPCDSPQVVIRNRCPKVLPIRWHPPPQRRTRALYEDDAPHQYGGATSRVQHWLCFGGSIRRGQWCVKHVRLTAPCDIADRRPWALAGVTRAVEHTHNAADPPAKLGTAYRNGPRHTG